MLKSKLVYSLRRRLFSYKLFPREILDRLSEDNVLKEFIIWGCCQERRLAEEDLPEAIASATTDEDFLERLSVPHDRRAGTAYAPEPTHPCFLKYLAEHGGKE